MGEFNGISSLASGLTSGLTCIVRICEFTYALKAVSEQTFAYLQTTEHVSENIKTAQRLRQQRENFLPAEEKRDMDRVIRETETAVRCVAKLLEQTATQLTAPRTAAPTKQAVEVGAP